LPREVTFKVQLGHHISFPARSNISTREQQVEVGRSHILNATLDPDHLTHLTSLLGGLLGVGSNGLGLSSRLRGLDEAHLSSLAGNTLLLADGVLGTASLTLGFEFSVTELLGLELVDGFHKDVLVLELVTLASEVELVVDVTVDFLGVTISLEEATEDTSAAHGENAGGHTGVASTTAATSTGVTSLALLGFVTLYAGARVHVGGLTDDDTILVELADVLACIEEILIKFSFELAEHRHDKHGLV
jgi:hypothetical protein